MHGHHHAKLVVLASEHLGATHVTPAAWEGMRVRKGVLRMCQRSEGLVCVPIGDLPRHCVDKALVDVGKHAFITVAPVHMILTSKQRTNRIHMSATPRAQNSD